MSRNYVEVGYVRRLSILLTGGLFGDCLSFGTVSSWVYFGGGRAEQTLHTGGPQRIHPNIPRPFSRKAHPKDRTNKNDLNILELERSDDQNCLQEKMVWNFAMFLSFSIILNEVRFIHILN